MAEQPNRRSVDYIDPVVENRIQEVVGITRHRLSQELAVLAVNQADAKLQATEEHGEVRHEIATLRSEISALRRDLEQVLPLRDSVEQLKHRDEVDDAREATSKALLSEMQAQRSQTRTWRLAVAAAVSTAVVGVAGVLVVLL